MAVVSIGIVVHLAFVLPVFLASYSAMERSLIEARLRLACFINPAEKSISLTQPIPIPPISDHPAVLTPEHIMSLVNDVLTLTENYQSFSEEKQFDLHALLEVLANFWRSRCSAKNVFFYLKVASGVPRLVIGDESRISRVLMELLSNAVKFTVSGAVSLQASVARGSPASPRMRSLSLLSVPGSFMLRLSVVDTGPGIPAEHLPNLFKSPRGMSQAELVRRSDQGLGMPIIHSLCSALGGELNYASKVGLGSTFTVRIRLRVPAAGSAIAKQETSPSPKRIGKTGPHVATECNFRNSSKSASVSSVEEFQRDSSDGEDDWALLPRGGTGQSDLQSLSQVFTPEQKKEFSRLTFAGNSSSDSSGPKASGSSSSPSPSPNPLLVMTHPHQLHISEPSVRCLSVSSPPSVPASDPPSFNVDAIAVAPLPRVHCDNAPSTSVSDAPRSKSSSWLCDKPATVHVKSPRREPSVHCKVTPLSRVKVEISPRQTQGDLECKFFFEHLADRGQSSQNMNVMNTPHKKELRLSKSADCISCWGSCGGPVSRCKGCAPLQNLEALRKSEVSVSSPNLPPYL
eukprot:gb/GEZN01003606.1/.p1 GENE.gb/GEZN01003606.1/~~gb/GEZN01003606.1/.p1  ORF type:complete len:658 (+),score=33.62 gb/GEZN01003606.1/:260-1975(+)